MRGCNIKEMDEDYCHGNLDAGRWDVVIRLTCETGDEQEHLGDAKIDPRNE